MFVVHDEVVGLRMFPAKLAALHDPVRQVIHPRVVVRARFHLGPFRPRRGGVRAPDKSHKGQAHDQVLHGRLKPSDQPDDP